jgi:cysteine synthase B
LTHFVAALGTSGTFTGVSRRLKLELPHVECISVQPPSGFHGIEGAKNMEAALVRPGIYDPSLADRNVFVETEDAQRMARRLAREEGLLVGVSAGANVAAAVRIAGELAAGGRRGRIVTILCDGGERYLSERFWNDAD